MLDKHVPSLELCRKWKELGGRQDTVFSWVSTNEGKNWNVFVHHEEDSRVHIKAFAAPLASEMMEWLPKYIEVKKLVSLKSVPVWLTVHKQFDDRYLVSYKKKGVSRYIECEVEDSSLPNALTQMCISRKEEENGKG